MTQDPHRLSDDPAEPELARALREAQGDVLSPEAVARVRASLLAAGVGGGIAVAGVARSPWAKLLTAARVRLGLAGVGLVGLGIAGVVGFVSVRRTPSQAAAPTLTSPALDPPADPLGVPFAADPTPPSVTKPTSQPVTIGEAPKPVAQPSAAATPSPREGALLLEARRALGTNPARALALVRAHELEFPASQLRPERARIAAEARQRLER